MTAGMPAGRKSSRARCLAEQREAIAPRFMSVVHCVHQPWVSVSNWATEQPAAIRGTAPTPGPMNCGTHFYRRVSQVTRGSRLRGTVRCTGIPPGQSPATAPSHFFYIAVRSQEHTRPHEWRTPFAYGWCCSPTVVSCSTYCECGPGLRLCLRRGQGLGGRHQAPRATANLRCRRVVHYCETCGFIQDLSLLQDLLEFLPAKTYEPQDLVVQWDKLVKSWEGLSTQPHSAVPRSLACEVGG
jgi:hypothetical protein